jgi:hypothetical protein
MLDVETRLLVAILQHVQLFEDDFHSNASGYIHSLLLLWAESWSK